MTTPNGAQADASSVLLTTDGTAVVISFVQPGTLNLTLAAGQGITPSVVVNESDGKATPVPLGASSYALDVNDSFSFTAAANAGDAFKLSWSFAPSAG